MQPDFRGQATMEWLMLGLLALALLSIAALAVSRAQSAQATLAERRILQLEVEELGYYADQICVMGEGNARTVALSPLAFELRYNSTLGGLNMSRGNLQAFRKTICPAQADLGGYGAQAFLKFERDADGRAAVRIANAP